MNSKLPLVSDKPRLSTDSLDPDARDFAGNVSLVTLGCAKNTVDSEIMLGALRERGYRPVVDPELAELIIVNTCGFLQSAVEESIDRILEMASLKETARCKKLLVAGCMVERYREELKESLPEVDSFVSTDEILDVSKASQTTKECFDSARRPYFLYDESMPRLRSTARHTAYLKIAEGCDRPCSFCIIPKLRGKLRSREIASVVSEVKQLVEEDVKEICFVAQDLTAYGTDFAGNNQPQLGNLLRTIEEQTSREDEFYLRLHYAYPIGIYPELIQQIQSSRTIANYLDLPLQHVSNSVLKKMNRPLGGKRTRELIEMIREVGPEIALRTTLIVGFPGETEDDIRELEEFILEGHFTHVGAFKYSQEKEARSFSFEGQLDEELKEERRARIMAAQKKIVEERHQELVGKKEKVIIEGAHKDTDLLLVARAEWQAPETDGEIIINELADELVEEFEETDITEELKGRYAEVEISSSAEYDLLARLLSIY